MEKELSDTTVSKRIWGLTLLIFNAGAAIYAIVSWNSDSIFVIIGCILASFIGSLPALVIFFFTIYRIEWLKISTAKKINLLFFLNLIITLIYGICAGLLFSSPFGNYTTLLYFFEISAIVSGLLFTATAIATYLSLPMIRCYFSDSLNKTNTYMEQHEKRAQDEIHSYVPQQNQTQKNKVLIKAGVTAVLILLMMIPIVFIENLVKERGDLQKEIVKNVNNKWASAQTISNPYLVIPYNYSDAKGNPLSSRGNLILLPEKLNVNGKIIPSELHRSLHNVLLYRSEIKMDGNFQLDRLLKNKNGMNLILSEAKLCFGISDFKGVEEKINCTYNGNPLDLIPGLPVSNIDTVGLSSAITISADSLNKTIPFSLSVKIRGSEGLQFLPLGGNSEFNIASSWPHPSFSGNTSPTKREITNDGFTAKWNFNEANLPFDLLIQNENINREKIAFGVSMIQPIDEYAQTMRCVKYAILIIGLTFALSFVMEIMQKKPVHPIQYVLIGLALAIFYTLLLSISEFILFDYAYIIASTATILLIASYVQSHFKSWKAGGLFAGILTLLYSFIYILIKLEDTALLVGSIALFIILALVMYATRKINWYGL